MIDISLLTSKFDDISVENDKINVTKNLISLLEFLKDAPEYNFDMLTSIVAVDLQDGIELIYQLYSVENSEKIEISYITKNLVAPSVVNIYNSSYFDECEIYDLFGVNFDGNINLKRLLLPDTWIGHPLLKSYVPSDERLVWND